MMLRSHRTTRLAVALGLLGLIGALSAGRGTSAHEGHKRKNAPASSKKLKNPLAPTEENIALGRALFNQHCASCHGEDGKARTEIAAAMKRHPADLTSRTMSGITEGEIYWVVTKGIKKGGMPAYQTKANNQERWQMTLYVRRLMGGHGDHAGQAGAQHQHGANHDAVNQRGDRVMGFSHTKTTHHFRLKPDGGLIEVEANDSNDAASRTQIRTHLQDIARKFAAGDFNAPMLIHAQTPPGVPTMQRLKELINYQFEETERGARVRIVTNNAEAIAAVHTFLRFQISDHQTGDSTEVEKTP